MTKIPNPKHTQFGFDIKNVMCGIVTKEAEMTNNQRREMISVVGEALEQVVLPKFEKLEKKIDQGFEKLNEDVFELKDTTVRTELKLNSVVERQDKQNDNILKINKVLKLEPKV